MALAKHFEDDPNELFHRGIGWLRRGCALLFVITLSLVPALAKDPRPEPISTYMRNVGLLYLETVKELTWDCAKNQACIERWDSTMNSLEDRITISLDEPGRPGGDKPLFQLLMHARHAHAMRVIESRTHPDTSGSWWVKADSICYEVAHVDALYGTYDSDGGCQDAIRATPAEPETDLPDSSYSYKPGCVVHSHTSECAVDPDKLTPTQKRQAWLDIINDPGRRRHGDITDDTFTLHTAECDRTNFDLLVGNEHVQKVFIDLKIKKFVYTNDSDKTFKYDVMGQKEVR